MSRHLTKLRTDRITRRRVTVGGVDLVLWFRVLPPLYPSGQWTPQIAVSPVGTRRTKLRWRPLSGVIADAFHLDVGLLFGQQLDLQEVSNVPSS